ncbi:MAG TPA: ATP-binding protein [Candidatus Limnocylindrales bacterium]|nr:ATP-binding protein [Candidatus Limnocylindrales bacterium]
MSTPLGRLPVRSPEDVRTLRCRAAEIAALAGFSAQDQVRISTAAAEIARNALQYASAAEAEFQLENPELRIAISDGGPGIGALAAMRDRRGLGLEAAEKLLDRFEIKQDANGCTALLFMRLPSPLSDAAANQLAEAAQRAQLSRADELRSEDELRLRVVEELGRRQQEAGRIAAELEDTNRGVLALYAELDEKAERLRRADEMKSRFLSHMSHEFRTPLTSIMALSRLLLDEVDGKLNSEQQKQATFIRRSAESLLEMVNDLLDLARVEAGRSVVRVSRFEVANLFGALRSLLRPLQVNPAVELIFEEAAELPSLLTDEAKVTQILRNFISNALKFTEKGEVRAAARLHEDGDRVVFSVADTGIGIDPRNQALIFRDFSQIENPLQNTVKGTGLGLSLSKGLAELLGGCVRVESEPGKGATFFAEIPIHYAAAEAEGGGVLQVLVIDDEEVSRYVARHALGSGINVIEAADGLRGIALARQHRPKGILLDLNMHPMDGFQVLDELKRDQITRDIPVVILTSKTLSRAERDILGSRVAACLIKEVLSQPDAGEKLRSALGVRQASRRQHQ